MGDYLFIVPLLVAVAIGWWLGRREASVSRSQKLHDHFSKAYFTGLSQLIDNDAHNAIDSFIDALKHNTEAVQLRLALGTLFRQQGELQRATQLHQEILAYPELSHDESLQVRLALAEDYLAAGLLDRAENLLLDFLPLKSKHYRIKALRLLIALYEREKEWVKALALADELGSGAVSIAVARAHYCCELAHQAQQQSDDKAVRRWLKRALEIDPCCVRASLLLADWEMQQQHWRAAIKLLRCVEEQAPSFVSEAVPRLVTCYRQLGAAGELGEALEVSIEKAPSTTTLLALADHIAAERGDYQAASFITDYLKRRPTVKGFNRLIDFHMHHADEGAKESLAVLRGLSGQLLQAKPSYRCVRCGFTGKRLHWLCPSCRTWGAVEPIQGLEGE